MDDPNLNEYGMTELLLAAYHGELDWVQNCIGGGLSVHARDNGGMTPLHWVADMGTVGSSQKREEIFKLLVECGADVQAVDNNGESVLARAVLAGNKSIIQLLIEAKADVNAADNRGRRPLTVAVELEMKAVIRLLKQAGAMIEG